MNSAKSSSLSTLRRQSTAATEPPGPRSRSKPRESDLFLLWIPDYLQDLENQLQSKRRTLELLQSDPRGPDFHFQEQIESRDLLISSLNKSILELKTELKSRESRQTDRNLEKQFQVLEKEVEDLRQTKEDLIEKLQDIELKFLEHQNSWENEKIEMEIMQDVLKDESEQFKTILQSQEIQIKEADEDLLKLQEVILSLNSLNTSLQEKLEIKNKETEENLLKYQDSLVRASQAEDLEKRLNFYFIEKIESEKKISQLLLLAENSSRLNSVLDWAGKNLEILEENGKKYFEIISKPTFQNNEKNFIDLQFFFKELTSSLATVRHNLLVNKVKEVEGLSTEASLRNLIKEKELEIVKKDEYVNSFKAKEEALTKKLKEIEMLMDKHRIEFKNEINKLSKLPQVYNDQFSKQREKISSLSSEIEKLSVQLNSTKLKLSHLKGRLEQSHKRKKELQEINQELKKTSSELREKLKIIIEGRKDKKKTKGSQKIQIKKILSQAQILRDEVFRKDTELVKAAREKLRFEHELSAQSSAYQKLLQKFKTVQSEVSEKAEEDLQEKNRQVEILKEMLRSAHSEIKIKDMKIASNLKKSEEFERFKSPRRGTII
jgi:hypothetical protein